MKRNNRLVPLDVVIKVLYGRIRFMLLWVEYENETKVRVHWMVLAYVGFTLVDV